MTYTYTADTPGVLAVLDLGALYGAGTTIAGTAVCHVSANVPGVTKKVSGYIIASTSAPAVGVDYGGSLADAIDSSIPCEPAFSADSTSGDEIRLLHWPGSSAISGTLATAARYLILIAEPYGFTAPWYSDGDSELTGTPTGSIVPPDPEPDVDDDAPDPEPAPPGGMLLEIYVNLPGGPRWGVARWGEDVWGASGWVNVTPEGVTVTVNWGTRRADLGILATVDAATWAIDTYDPDRDLDPANASSPYAGELLPGLPVRISHHGTEVRRGHVESLGYSLATDSGYIRVTDAIARLANADVPDDTTLPDTLRARARSAIAAAGLNVEVEPDPPGDDPPVAPRLEGVTNAWAHIRDAAEQALYVPWVDRIGVLRFRDWDTPLIRGRTLAAPELVDLRSIVDYQGVYTVIRALDADDDTVYERRLTPVSPRIGHRTYERTKATPDAAAWAERVLADRAGSGIRWLPGAVLPLTAASVHELALIEAVELVYLSDTYTAPAVAAVMRVLGGTITIVGKRDAEAVWRFDYYGSQTGILSTDAPLFADGAGDTEALEREDLSGYLYPDTPALVIGPPGTIVRTLTSASTSADFAAAIADMSLDVIEFAAGTYSGWHTYVRQSRAARPLTIRPVAGAAVVFEDSAGSAGGAGWLYLGANVGLPGVPTEATDYITIDCAYAGGSITVQDYDIGATGVIYTGWIDQITINDLVVRDITGVAGGTTSHCLYVSSDDVHPSGTIVANRWDVGPFAGRKVNGLQTYHAPSVSGLQAHGWIVEGCHRAAYLWADATGIDVDGWTITDCDATFDVNEDSAGTIRNSTATGSGSTAQGAGYWVNEDVTDAGGNSW